MWKNEGKGSITRRKLGLIGIKKGEDQTGERRRFLANGEEKGEGKKKAAPGKKARGARTTSSSKQIGQNG